MNPAKENRRKTRNRNPGDRKQFLVTMSSEVIKAVKQAGLEDDRPAWAIVEEAAKEWLQRRKTAQRERGEIE